MSFIKMRYKDFKIIIKYWETTFLLNCQREMRIQLKGDKLYHYQMKEQLAFIM